MTPLETWVQRLSEANRRWQEEHPRMNGEPIQAYRFRRWELFERGWREINPAPEQTEDEKARGERVATLHQKLVSSFQGKG